MGQSIENSREESNQPNQAEWHPDVNQSPISDVAEIITDPVLEDSTKFATDLAARARPKSSSRVVRRFRTGWTAVI